MNMKHTTSQQALIELNKQNGRYEILDGELWLRGHPLHGEYIRGECTALEAQCIDLLYSEQRVARIIATYDLVPLKLDLFAVNAFIAKGVK